MSSPAEVVVVDHHDSYTWNLVHLIAEVTGVTPWVVQHDEATLADILSHTHVVLSPGPGRPDRAADFAIGADVLRAGTRPVLGVCLGMQGLVTTFGGTVEVIEPAHGEVATIRHDGAGLFTGLPQGFAAVRYHSLAATAVPDELEVTATAGEVVMGVRHRRMPLAGVQFHPESILSAHGARIIENFMEQR